MNLSGGAFTKVAALLHSSDIASYKPITVKSPNLNRQEKAFQSSSPTESLNLISKGSRITVYVKEVWKNSG
jgi:hypothetical protein